ncbi:ATPase [Scytonema hofmannii PCC 7110]|uniref:ATPase n=1 Tax=Scytonema hofmannii PCC 7110 TaxID=128403 RepID=A0A139WQX1_9CYAN|nr:cation-translocating P-type ATPase [Scytonema hofmannii]KYC34843.1 ATPase [Scytonema hofmannii PCC 7110]
MTERDEREELQAQSIEDHDDDDLDEVEGFSGPWYTFPPIRNALIAGALLVTGWLVSQFNVPIYVPNSIFGLAILIGAYYWAREGWEEFIEEREVGIEALMAFATLGAVILEQWFEAAFLVFLYAGAESIEEYTFARTRTAIRALLDLVPETAALLTDTGEVRIPAKELKIDNVFLVRPGERIPTDGEIVEGASSIDEAAVTGESVPVEKAVGDKVFAGTINTTGVLKVRATTSFASNSLQKIIQTVEEAQGVKSSAQRWIDRFGRRYSPSVLVVALLLVVIPFLIKANFTTWAVRAVVLLVAAAPCALVISTPVAISAAIGRSGREGVLIKGGIHLENLAKVRVVAFDKTGTLTRGKPVVTNVLSTTNETASLMRSAASIEHLSEHPLAKAIVEKAQAEGVTITDVQNFQSLTGAGAKADIEGQTIYVGSPGLFRQLGVPLERLEPEIERLQAEGKTVVLTGTKDRIQGLFAIRDEPRPEAKRAIQQLHKMQVKVAMLTGDNARTAKAIAAELGIDEVRADLKPEDKVKAIQELEQQYGPVAMTGDGINDAPALATATVGLAMGTAGTDAAIEAADIALMGDDPSRVAYALKLAKASQQISFQNIVFSILVLAVLIPGALLGLLGITAAVFAHEASELLAIANGLRITRKRLA